MNCPSCKARNPIGGKFCCECGAKLELAEGTLAAEEAQRAVEERAKERTSQLMARALTLAGQGKHAEALPLVEEAAQLQPGSTAVQSRLGMLYERLGENAKAIQAFEKVVALNPDSAADRDRLDRLKRGVHLMPRSTTAPLQEEPEQSRRWLPVLVAATTGLIVVGGYFAFRAKTAKPERLEVTVVPKPTPSAPVTSTPVLGGVSMLGGPTLGAPTTISPEVGRPDPFAPVGNRSSAGGGVGWTNQPTRNTSAEDNRPRTGRVSSSNVLPNPASVGLAGVAAPPSARAQSQNVPPVTIGEGAGSSLPPLGGVQRGPEGEGSTAIPAGPPSGTAPAANPTPSGEAGNPGVINIRPAQPRSNNSGGTRSSLGNAGSEALLKAQSLQGIQRYREAVVAYRDALAAGAPAGEVQQAIALCYQNLGETSPARAAYQRAIAAFEAQIKAGHAVGAATRGLAACRAALDVLGS